MNFAFLIRSQAALTLRDWALGLVSTHRTAPPVLRKAASPGVRITATAPAIVHLSRPVVRPLRVVRVVESGQTRTDVGRMVISGRMAKAHAW